MLHEVARLAEHELADSLLDSDRNPPVYDPASHTVDCHTTYYSYPSGLTDPLDPRWDKPLTMRDARSVSATDNSYLTSYTYGSKGDLLSQTNPDTGSTRTAYSTGVEAAYNGGLIPSGLPVTSTDARNAITRFSYYANGDLAQIIEPSGLTTRYSYDVLGRKTSQTEISDGYPAGITTSFGYDAESRLTSTTEPATTDAVTGVQHQQQVNQSYDSDGNVTRTEVKDLLGGDPARTTDYTYDDHNRLASVVNPNGDEVSYDYDKFGNKIAMTDAVGTQYDYAYTGRGKRRGRGAAARPVLRRQLVLPGSGVLRLRPVGPAGLPDRLDGPPGPLRVLPRRSGAPEGRGELPQSRRQHPRVRARGEQLRRRRQPDQAGRRQRHDRHHAHPGRCRPGQDQRVRYRHSDPHHDLQL